MSSANVYIRLRGGRAERFRQIQGELEDHAGHELDNTETVTMLMMNYDIEDGEPKPLLEQ